MTRSDPLASDDPKEVPWLQQGAASSAPNEGAAGSAGAPAPVAPAPPPPPPEPVAVPIRWLVERAAAPIRYRAIVDLAKVSPLPDRLLSLVFAFEPAVKLALSQRPDGIWHNAMLALPAARSTEFDGVGTILAYRRLLEYGWDREAPPLFHARRLLFRLLTEDNDPALLFELAEKARLEEGVRRSRALLREAAAAALAQAGYEGDPRLRGAAQRMLQRVIAHVRSPLAADPWTTAGGKRVLAPAAAPPSYFLLVMLAHMPLFRLEHASEIDDLLKYLTNVPGGEEQGSSNPLLAQRLILTGDPLADEDAANNDIAFTIAWLELAARLGYLKRHDGWSRTFDRLLEQCDESWVWRARRGQLNTRASNSFVWPTYPLIPNATPDDQAAEITFRLGLIARFAGRPLELV